MLMRLKNLDTKKLNQIASKTNRLKRLKNPVYKKVGTLH